MDHFIGGIASSMVLAIARDDKKHDQIIHQLEVRLEFKLLDPLSYIGVVGCDGEPRITSVDAVIYAVSLAQIDELTKCINRALHHYVVYQTRHYGIVLTLKLGLSRSISYHYHPSLS